LEVTIEHPLSAIIFAIAFYPHCVESGNQSFVLRQIIGIDLAGAVVTSFAPGSEVLIVVFLQIVYAGV
jgi:hypothetical protein